MEEPPALYLRQPVQLAPVRWPLATYGAYTLASANTNNPLPIGLSAFTAEYGFSGVEVRWTTETETNNDYFVVERTADAESFEKDSTGEGSWVPQRYSALASYLI